MEHGCSFDTNTDPPFPTHASVPAVLKGRCTFLSFGSSHSTFQCGRDSSIFSLMATLQHTGAPSIPPPFSTTSSSLVVPHLYRHDPPDSQPTLGVLARGFSLVQESFAIMLAIMLVVADLSSIVVVGHIFRVDRLVGWWPLSTTFSEELRVRQALYLSHQFKRTSQIPTSVGKDGEYSEADWEGAVTTDERPAKSWQEKLSSVANSLKTSLGEDGMFSYPSAVLIATFVTPILLVWLYAVSLHLVSILVSLLDDVSASLASFDGRAELAQSVVRANAAAMCGNDTQCMEALEEILSVVGTARSTAGSLHSWIGNTPDVIHITFLVSTSVSFVVVLSLVVRNVIDFKVWNLRIWAGQKLGGFNVTTGRKGHDIARSAEYVAVFASTHIIGYATMSLTLGVLFTLVAYSKTWVLILEHMQFLLTYIIVYVIVYYLLRTVVGNTWLSDGEYAKRPRRLSNFLSGLSVYYITSALLAAVSRLVIAVPYFFYMFCRVHYSPFAGAWQRYDYPFRASQSLLQHHTRSQNAHMIGFAGALVQSTEPHRKSAMAASEARLIAGEAVGATPLEAPRWHNHGARARNQWRVAYTLVANPELIALRAGATPVDSAE
jgi:hypothetical protein